MLNRPTQSSYKEPYFQRTAPHNPNHIIHHGLPDSRLLLDVPSETLLGITSYLDPPSLLVLARVHVRLNQHVKDDNTWYRAFLCQFLGIGPESNIQDSKRNIMLRRSESTWKKEFIFRYNLKRRWEKSRNSIIAHIPVNSEISSIHLMPGDSLLTSSIQYGIVSRSLPLSGKILPGYIDASGAHLGLGVGNPNAEFTPNVSACALTSDGGTAKVLWGFRHGEVAITTVPRAMDSHRRPMAELLRCDPREQHEGAVLDVGWDDAANTLLASAGADGRVKVWDAKTVRCLWTSERNVKALVPQAYVKVKLSPSQSFVVAVTRSGEIVLWPGFDMQTMGSFNANAVHEVRVACPVVPRESQAPEDTDTREILACYVDPHASIPTVLVAYRANTVFNRIRIEETGNIDIGTFGDASFGAISAVAPCFDSESSFILAGDHLGCVSVYNWRSEQHPAPPIRKFEAHDMASVSAIAWNGVTLITGSANGTTHAWDALTFEHLKSFASPVPRMHRGRGGAPGNGAVGDRAREAVRQILVGQEKGVMVVSVGDRVLAWKAGPAPNHHRGGVRGRHSSGPIPKKKDSHGGAKYHEQLELHQSISESRFLLRQESEFVRKANGREKEQREQLESMGLNEVEAVEYVLMLSRDEAMENGTFISGDFEGAFGSTPNSMGSPSSPATPKPSTPHRKGRPIPRASPSKSNEKVQVSPPLRAEPMEAGIYRGSSSPQSHSGSDMASDEAHFPSISAASSSVSGSPNTASITSAGATNQGSPQPIRLGRPSASAWNTPLTLSKLLSGASSGSSGSVSGSRRRSLHAGVANWDEEIDQELRLALELSLVEAGGRREAS